MGFYKNTKSGSSMYDEVIIDFIKCMYTGGGGNKLIERVRDGGPITTCSEWIKEPERMEVEGCSVVVYGANFYGWMNDNSLNGEDMVKMLFDRETISNNPKVEFIISSETYNFIIWAYKTSGLLYSELYNKISTMCKREWQRYAGSNVRLLKDYSIVISKNGMVPKFLKMIATEVSSPTLDSRRFVLKDREKFIGRVLRCME